VAELILHPQANNNVWTAAVVEGKKGSVPLRANPTESENAPDDPLEHCGQRDSRRTKFVVPKVQRQLFDNFRNAAPKSLYVDRVLDRPCELVEGLSAADCDARVKQWLE
jgi:hypothetical protein